MSVRAAPLNTAAADLGTAIAEVQPEAAALAEGNSFATQSSENPLTRHVVVSIRASLNGAPVPFKNPRAPHAHTHTHTLSCAHPPHSPFSRPVPPEVEGHLGAVARGPQVDL